MSLAPAANIGALLFLQLSVFSILGMQIFGSTGDWEANVLPSLRNSTLAEFGQIQQTKTANFENFYHGIKLLFECMSGKDWKIVMYEVDLAGGGGRTITSFAFFFLHYFFSVFILCNLFVAVIVDAFDMSMRETQLEVTLENMATYNHLWKAHALHHGYASDFYIERRHIECFLKDVGLFKGSSSRAAIEDRRYHVLADEHHRVLLRRQFGQAEETLAKLRAFHKRLPIVHRSLEETVTVWDKLLEPSGGPHGRMGGLHLPEEEVKAMDSGGLVPVFTGGSGRLTDGKGSIRLTVRKAVDLPPMDVTGQTDCYVRISVEGRQFRTKVSNSSAPCVLLLVICFAVCVRSDRAGVAPQVFRQSLNPVWDETFTIPVRKRSSLVQIDLYDDDTFDNDDLISTAVRRGGAASPARGLRRASCSRAQLLPNLNLRHPLRSAAPSDFLPGGGLRGDG
jgi:hypothetical protein